MLETREGEIENLAKTLESLEKEWDKGKMEMLQMSADMKNAEDQNLSLSDKVSFHKTT